MNFFSAFHNPPQRNASLHSKEAASGFESWRRAVPPPCSLSPQGDSEHGAGVRGKAMMTLMTRQARPQSQRLLREKDETWHLHPETVRRATNTAATMLNAGTGVLREKDNTLHLHPVTVRRTANAAAKTYAMCSRVCLFDGGKLPGPHAQCAHGRVPPAAVRRPKQLRARNSQRLRTFRRCRSFWPLHLARCSVHALVARRAL